jgi:hypothetical protein
MNDLPTPKSRKILDQIRDAIRLKHYSYSTETTYVHWARRYILFHHKRHPAEMGVTEIEAFLTHLVKKENVFASTHFDLAVRVNSASGVSGLLREGQTITIIEMLSPDVIQNSGLVSR